MSDLISRREAIDAFDEIRHALWEIDIPSPTVPEYVEHHEQVQSVWKLLDKKQKELYLLPSAQPTPKKGRWEESTDYYNRISGRCSACGWEAHLYEDDVVGMPYCPNCGARMEGTE